MFLQDRPRSFDFLHDLTLAQAIDDRCLRRRACLIQDILQAVIVVTRQTAQSTYLSGHLAMHVVYPIDVAIRLDTKEVLDYLCI